MKRNILFGLCAGLLLLAGCSDFTEIQPKGKNLLTRVSDLDLLLNYEYNENGYYSTGPSVVLGEMYPQAYNVPNMIAETTPALNAVLITWDETADRLELSNSDGMYTCFYSAIGRIANPVLQQIDNAEGDRATAQRIKAEALVFRAWFHYLAVNIYAKAYDPATAATDPGVPYMLEGSDIAGMVQKNTVGEVYDHILADLNTALELESLPDRGISRMRPGKDFALAAKAQVLMNMHRYGEASQAASQSLAITDYVEDERSYFDTEPNPFMGSFTRSKGACQEDLICFPQWNALFGITPEMYALFEPGHVWLDYCFDSSFAYSSMYFGLADVAYSMCMDAYFSYIGLTTIDTRMIEAECLMREGEFDDALALMDEVREMRIDPAVYQPWKGTTTDRGEVFRKLQQVWRTENLYTMKNFINMKRWNTEPEYQTTLRKTLLGKDYELTPDSPLWIFPIPLSASSINPNLTPNY